MSAVPNIGVRPRLGGADAPRLDVGRALSEMLLAPIVSYLSHERILIVADGPLLRLPFSALPDPRWLSPSAERIALVVNHEVTYLPSVSTIALLRGAWNRERQWPKPLMVFADPVFEADDPRIADAGGHGILPKTTPTVAGPLSRALRDVRANPGSGIPRLLATRQEARGIAALVPQTEVALDFRASRETVTSLTTGEHRIVHFATHGLADSQHPELSGIVLSLYDRMGRPQDGFLRLDDIYNLSMPADLVVLSACDTGFGKEVAGEGLMGLVRGFMYAGTRRVLASLWKVDDEATSELMMRFYRNLFQRRMTAAAALRAAQVEFRSTARWNRPFYWAAFVLQGDWTEQTAAVTPAR
jgi:CHAT domain-containing protein